MKKIITFLAMAVMGTAYGQRDTDIVHIPDKNFKRALINHYPIIDTNRDKQISYAEARAYNGEINAENRHISDLTGIEAFVNITKLHITDNELTNLDVSKNTALQSLFCSNNQLTQLNLANGKNNRLISLATKDNPNLMCIQIDKGFTTDRWSKDSHALYSDNCNYPTLSITEIKAENAIQILNPVKDNLVIKTTAKVEKVEIYNTAGQLVKVLFRWNTQVQDLAKGIYLLKITTDKGVITQKIIKS